MTQPPPFSAAISQLSTAIAAANSYYTITVHLTLGQASHNVIWFNCHVKPSRETGSSLSMFINGETEVQSAEQFGYTHPTSEAILLTLHHTAYKVGKVMPASHQSTTQEQSEKRLGRDHTIRVNLVLSLFPVVAPPALLPTPWVSFLEGPTLASLVLCSLGEHDAPSNCPCNLEVCSESLNSKLSTVNSKTETDLQ